MSKRLLFLSAALGLFGLPSRGQLSATGHLERATGAYRGEIDAVTHDGRGDGSEYARI